MEKYEGMNLMKVKRKELEEVNDDFSDFSLSSPARKIRRLDVELPPIIEEEEADIPLGYEKSIPENVMSDCIEDQLRPPVMPFVPENDEKAIVVFKPMSTQLSYSVDPNLISSFKNQAFWGSSLNASGLSNKDQDVADGDDVEVNACRAVIPWVPSQQPNLVPEVPASQTEVSESMDADEPEVTTMEIEDAGANVGQHVGEYDLSRLNEGLHNRWQQQHCMIPQPPQNPTTPIVWYR